MSNHPWIQAAQNMQPTRIPTQFGMMPVEANTDDGPVNLAAIVIATPSGVTSVFLLPDELQRFLDQGHELQQYWETSGAATPKLILPDTATIKNINGKRFG